MQTLHRLTIDYKGYEIYFRLEISEYYPQGIWYATCGDTHQGTLQEAYDSMTKWIDELKAESEEYDKEREKKEFQPHYPPIGNPKLIELLECKLLFPHLWGIL